MIKDMWDKAFGDRKFYTGRRSFKVGPLRVNTVWFKPTSISLGGGPGRINVGANGRKRTSVRIPGLGGTWQKTWGTGRKKK